MKHTDMRWNPSTGEWFCQSCGRTSGVEDEQGRGEESGPIRMHRTIRRCFQLELFHDSVPSLKSLTVGFELLSGTTPAQLKALLDVMNERIVGTIVTPRDSSTR
jgi:hypothetical protein